MPRAMVVDDDDSTRKILRLLLEKRGLHVLDAVDGAAALQALEKEKVDFLLLDMMMPNLSGTEVLEKLRLNPATSKIPVLCCTADATRTTVQKAISHNIKGYLLKPINSVELNKKVGDLMLRLPEMVERPARAAARLGMKEEQLNQLRREFHAESLGKLKEVRSALAESNLELCKSLLQKIIESATSLGANSLQRLAREALEQLPGAAPELQSLYFNGLQLELAYLSKCIPHTVDSALAVLNDALPASKEPAPALA